MRSLTKLQVSDQSGQQLLIRLCTKLLGISVLPTSGSRGCTAAVVELVFNADLVADEKNSELGSQTVPVYRGEVEFIRLEDWKKELRLLVDECSTQDKQVYALPPDADRQPDAAAAWQKIDQVYGKGE